MKLGIHRIFAILTAVFVLLSALAALGAYQVLSYGESADRATLQRYRSYLLADELRQSSDDLTRLARTFVVSAEPKWEKQYFEILDIRNGKLPRPLAYERIYWDFKAADLAVERGSGAAMALTQLMKEAGFTEAEFGKLNEAKANSDDLVRTETIAMNMVKGLYADGSGGFSKHGEPDAAKAREMMHDLTYHQYKAKIMKPVDEFLALLDQRTSQEVLAAQQARALWSKFALGAVALLAIGSSLMLVWAKRRIFAIFGEVRRVASTIASGDLSKSIDVGGADEAGELMRALDAMQTSLRGIITQVRHSSESIATGSSEIARGNADLSHRTELQASNLQQTAASMEQLTGTVRHTADTAREATALAGGAAQAAATGGTVVAQAVHTMEDITTASKKIADITGVIDGIAFQTNILALNAAVEAARAGEQGRGFAVVAAEVRLLAQRAANAAKEIKALIGASVEKVDAGTQQVHAAGRSMDDIVAQAKRVSQLISDISSAANEQTTGIDQVSSAVGQLDQVTQQNAALVEQSAAAAESLKLQARQLADVVQVFKLGENG